MTNLIQKLLGSGITPVAAERTAERFRQYRTSGNGKIEVYLPPARGDELRAKLIDASKKRDNFIDTISKDRDEAVKIAKQDYEKARTDIEARFRKMQAQVLDEYDAAEHALLAEYSQALTPEQIALLTTPIGSVVRVPSPAPSTALAGA